jgi:mitochondrial fission protein ELM1
MASTLISFAYKIDSITHVADFDLLISAGGNTSFLNAELGAREGIKNLFMGSLRNLSADLFSAVLTLEPINTGNDIVMDCPPSLTTYENNQQAAATYRENHDMGETPIWLMIVGGDGAGCRFVSQDWIALAEGMQHLAERYQITWLLTTSRRTGIKNEIELQKRIAPNVLLDAVWYNHKPEKVMQAYLGLAENVFCTIDSISMITEAISSCVKTNSLAPEVAKLDVRDQDAMDKFSAMKLLKKIRLDELSDYDYSDNEFNLKSLVDSHYQKLAADIKNILV